MVDVLKRMNNQEESIEEEDSDDDEEPADMSERLAGVDLDQADAVWDRLTTDEKREFEELLKHGDVNSIIPDYVPWWKYWKEDRKVEEIGNEDNEETKHIKKCPPIQEKIKKLPEMTKVPPSKYVKNGLLNVLYGYAYAVRYMHGDYTNNPCEFIEIVQLLSANLRTGANYELADTALESAASEVANHAFLAISIQFSRSVKKDVYEITRGPSKKNPQLYVLAALSDLKTLFQEAKNILKRGKGEREVNLKVGMDVPVWKRSAERKPKLDISDLRKQCKKIEYYLSLCHGLSG